MMHGMKLARDGTVRNDVDRGGIGSGGFGSGSFARGGMPRSMAIAALVAAAWAAPLAMAQQAPATQPQPAKPEAAKPEPAKPEAAKPSEPKAQGAPSSGTTTAAVVAAATTKIVASQLGVSYESYSSGIPQRDTVARMMRVLSVDVNEQRLEDVANFIIETTGADLEFLWGDGFSGLDKEKAITLKATNRTALQLLELVLDKAAADIGTGATWQMTESGTMQAGTKDSLNKFKRLEVYPIADLMLETPDYADAPIFDLQQAFQQSGGGRGGGGGTQSPFRQTGNDEGPERKPEEDRANEVVDIIRTLVEPEQWDSGGATIRYWQKTLLVNAPDYVHRQLNGYAWWPKPATTSVARASGGRYVTLGIDTGITGLPEFQPLAVTGTAGGGGGAPGGGAGGGGGSQPVKPGGGG